MTLVRLDHNLPQLLSGKIDMLPLQSHHIHHTESAGMEGKEKHLQKLLAARFGSRLVIFKQGKHLLFGQAFAIKLRLFFRKRNL